MRRMFLAAALALAALVVSDRSAAQVAGFPPPPPKVSPAAGAIDIHVHSEPDVFGRSMDDIDVAVLAKRKGLRGIVLKNHVTNTADRAVLVQKIVPDLEVFGGVVLNKSVGGLNPAAVEAMYRMSGGRGKVVWLPTFDSDKHVKTLVSKDQSGIVVAPNGVVVPPLEEILKIIARENLVLATGHVHAEEVVAVVKRARELGVKSIVVTHGLTNIPGLTMAQAKQVAQMGAYIEICHLQTMTGPNAQYDWMRHWTQVSVKDVATAVREVGADHLILSTDLGQRGMMTHPDGIEQMIQQVKAQGVSQEDLDKMVKTNPARLLGLGT
jgi:hypothetical protein